MASLHPRNNCNRLGNGKLKASIVKRRIPWTRQGHDTLDILRGFGEHVFTLPAMVTFTHALTPRRISIGTKLRSSGSPATEQSNSRKGGARSDRFLLLEGDKYRHPCLDVADTSFARRLAGHITNDLEPPPAQSGDVSRSNSSCHQTALRRSCRIVPVFGKGWFEIIS